jgi:hypothetical protein
LNVQNFHLRPPARFARPGYAKKLVRAFGEAVFDVVEGDPKRLQDVDGISRTASPDAAKKLQDTGKCPTFGRSAFGQSPLQNDGDQGDDSRRRFRPEQCREQ